METENTVKKGNSKSATIVSGHTIEPKKIDWTWKHSD